MNRNLIKIYLVAMVIFCLLCIPHNVNALVIEGAGVGGSTKSSTSNTTTSGTSSTTSTSSTTEKIPIKTDWQNYISNKIEESISSSTATGTNNSTTSSQSTQQNSTTGTQSRITTNWQNHIIDKIDSQIDNTNRNNNSTVDPNLSYTGWNANGTKYYVDGQILKNTRTTIDNTMYNIDSDGKVNKYNGIMGGKYYERGQVVTDKKTYNINDVYYDINKNGKVTKLNNTIRDNKYYDSKGKLVTGKKTYEINGIYYDINKNGKLTKLNNVIRDNKYYNSKGKLVTDKKTYEINGIYYDINKNGKLTKLNNVIRDNKYYNSKGKLVTDKKTYEINGIYYDINKNGKITKLNEVLRNGKYYEKGKIKYAEDDKGVMKNVSNGKPINKWINGIRYVEGVKYIYKDDKGNFRYSTGSNKGKLYTGQVGKRIYNDGTIVAKSSDDGKFYKFINNQLTTELFTGAAGDKYFQNGEVGGTICVDNKYYRDGILSKNLVLRSCERVKEKLMARGCHYPEEMNYSLLDNTRNIKYHLESAHYIVCATFVAAVEYDAGFLSEDIINNPKYYYHSADSIGVMLEDAGFKKIVLTANDTLDSLRPEDVVVIPTKHVLIYAGNNEYYDQKCCVVGAYGNEPTGYIQSDFWEKYSPTGTETGGMGTVIYRNTNVLY